MKQYIDIARTILETGVRKPNRTGIDSISCFGMNLRHDLADGFPLLTSKKMDGRLWNSIVEELLWFISGENHIRNFTKKSSIWDSWADQDGNLESAYGWFWRHFPVAFGGKMHEVGKDEQADNLLRQHTDWGVSNFDQLGWCVEQLKTNPTNRRLVVSAWNPGNAYKSKLPPCHMGYVFNVQSGRLCLQFQMRSVDWLLGCPFNIASYALLTHIIARETNLKPGILSANFVDAHIYVADEDDETIVNGSPRKEYDHTKVIREQITREPFPLSQLEITGGDWQSHKFDDFKLIDYKSHAPLKAKVAV